METASGEGDFRMMRRCVADAILQLGESNRYTKGIFTLCRFSDELDRVRECRAQHR